MKKYQNCVDDETYWRIIEEQENYYQGSAL